MADYGEEVEGPIHYWVHGTAEEAERDSSLVQKIMGACFLGRAATFEIRSQEHPDDVWINGTTYAFWKGEGGHHPAAWGKAWSSFVSAVAHSWDFLNEDNVMGASPHLLSNVQLLEHRYLLNGWEAFWMQIALQAAAATAPGQEFGHLYHSVSHAEPALPLAVTYGDQGTIKRNKAIHGNSGICFEHAFSSRPIATYFQDHSEGALFRELAHRALFLKPDVPHPCQPADLQVLILERNRPLWNQADVVALLHQYGLRNIQFATLSEATPYATQATLFYEADIVITVHGSQIANLVFMRQGGAIMEIFPHKYYHDEPGHFGRNMGQNHIPINNNPLPSEEMIRSKDDPELLRIYKQALLLTTEFPDNTACGGQFRCRAYMRPLGALADMLDVENTLKLMLDTFRQQAHCN
ncbi:hypothetical protein P7C70_g6868, partial [Phenoliferia sp. Uapishka_3]